MVLFGGTCWVDIPTPAGRLPCLPQLGKQHQANTGIGFGMESAGWCNGRVDELPSELVCGTASGTSLEGPASRRGEADREADPISAALASLYQTQASREDDGQQRLRGQAKDE